jgi:dTDP-4-dehydrorhamnose 3,5-epimerase
LLWAKQGQFKEHAAVEITQTALPGVLLLKPARFGDARGFFSESWNRETLASHGITLDFVQDNHSLSSAVGTVRGLHFQAPPHAQDKLVRCGRGALFDVAVDIRKGSPTFGRWVGYYLTAENGLQLLIPKGFLHGFVTRAPETEIVYKCTDYYAPDCDGAVRFDDPDLGIDWGLTEDAVLSDKDAHAPLMADFESPFTYGGTA